MMERVIQNLADNAIKNTYTVVLLMFLLSWNMTKLYYNLNDAAPLANELGAWINDFESNKISTGNRPQKAGLGILIVQKILQLHDTSLHLSRTNGKNIFTFRMQQYKILNVV